MVRVYVAWYFWNWPLWLEPAGILIALNVSCLKRGEGVEESAEWVPDGVARSCFDWSEMLTWILAACDNRCERVR